VIPYGKQDIRQEDIDAVVEVLKSDFITQGPQIPKFEKAIAEKVLAKHAIAVNSATSALHIACLALDLNQGDYLWTTPLTFVASANCGRYCGAIVDFVDIDPRTFNICPSELSKKLLKAKQNKCLPKILIVTHLCGQPCNMERINSIAKEYSIRIIEDASHAIGGRYKDDYIGNCKYSDITVFSFHPVKIITTAEGGIAMTNSDLLASKMNLYRSHGITRDPELMSKDMDGPWYYQQIALGFNYRITDLQAALSYSQLSRLDEYVEKRHLLADRYDNLLKELPIRTPWRHEDSYSAFHLYVIRIDLNNTIHSRKEIFEELRGMDVGVDLHYIPVHLHPYYAEMGFQYGDFPEAESYYSDAISIPIYPTLTEEDQNHVIKSIKKALI